MSYYLYTFKELIRGCTHSMSNDDFKIPYYENVFIDPNPNNHGKTIDRSSVTWYEETQSFDSMYEVQEWVSSDAYNRIGHEFDGYKSIDPKFAYALLFLLVQGKTYGYVNKEICADTELVENKLIYLVWLSSE